MKSDTIAAIATALSDAGIGIIRISGPEAIAVANRVVVNKKKEHTLKNWQTHTIHYGFVEENGTIMDEVMVSVMKAPRELYDRGHGRDQLPRRRAFNQTCVGGCSACRCEDGGAGRIYETSVFERQNRLIRS